MRKISDIKGDRTTRTAENAVDSTPLRAKRRSGGNHRRPLNPWEMTPDEFDRLARRGRIGPYSKPKDAHIRAVVRGEKPVALLFPREVPLARRLGLEVRWTSDSRTTRLRRRWGQRVAYRPGDEAAFRRIDRVLRRYPLHLLLRPGITEAEEQMVLHHDFMLNRVEEGRALGYSEADIAAYMDQNFGHWGVVERALTEGRRVPRRVLKCYPTLVRKLREHLARSGRTRLGDNMTLIQSLQYA